jgi:DNA polymerase-4
VLRLRFDDFSRATRSHTLPHPTAHTATILNAARALLAVVSPVIEQRGITLIGLSISNLDDDDAVQLELPFDRDGEALDEALDLVRDRFGTSSLTRAVLLGRAGPPPVPMLPD